jgi:DNA (cytosine-5)-methyltransferase 1
VRVRLSRQPHGRVDHGSQGLDEPAPTVKADVDRGRDFGWILVELEEGDVLNARKRRAGGAVRAQRSGQLTRVDDLTDRPSLTIGAMTPTDVYLDVDDQPGALRAQRSAALQTYDDVTDDPAYTIATWPTYLEVDPGASPPPADGKPPYRPPPVAEVLAAEPNGLTAISTFCGCGGSSIGYRLAGYRIAAAVDVDETACASYRANFPGTPLLERDVHELAGAELLAAAGLAEGELDLLDGSPPCTPFSSAGRKQRTWGHERVHAGKRQRIDDLFLEYARLLAEIRPRAFVAENVAGLARGVAVGYFREIRAALADVGYHVEVRQLDAQWMGVPQARQRLIFAGLRLDLWDELGLDALPWPAPLPYRYSVREALPWLDPAQTVVATRGTPWGDPARVAAGRGTPTEVEIAAGDPAKTIPADPTIEVRLLRDTQGDHQAADPERSLDEPVPSMTPGSRGWNADHFQVEARVEHDTGRRGRGRRDVTDAPSPAVTLGTDDPAAGGGARQHFKVVREDERGVTLKRKFTILEVKRLFAFPDDYELAGKYAQQWAQLGNSVAPPMARGVGEALAPVLQAARR